MAGATPPTYSSLVLGRSPSVYYRLGETSGTAAADASTHALTGTYVNAPTLGHTGLIAGDTNKAAAVTAANVAVMTASGAALPSGSTPRTLEVWLNDTNTGPSYPNVLSVGDFALSLSNGKPALTGAGVTLPINAVPVLVPDGKSHLLVGSFDGTTAVLYLDGVEVSRAAMSLNTAASPTLTVGGSGVGTTYDEVAVYPSALTAIQVNADWTRGGSSVTTCATASSRYSTAVMADTPAAYYRLGDNPGSTPVAFDVSGNCRNGAYTSAATNAAGTIAGDGDSGVKSPAGSSAAVMWANGAALPTGASPRTVETWFSGTDASIPYPNVVTLGDFQIEFYGGIPTLKGGGVAAPINRPPLDLRDGRAHLLTATFDGSTAILYVDGVEVDHAALTVNTVLPSQLTVGGAPSWTFDEVAVYPTALSAAKVDAHWTAGASSGPACATAPTSGYASVVMALQPVAYYRLDENPAVSAVAYDSSGHCRNGAYTSVASAAPGIITNDADAAVSSASGATAGVMWANGAALPEGSSARTVEVWLQGTDLSKNYPNVASLGDGTVSAPGANFEMALYNGTPLLYGPGTGPNGYVPSPTNIELRDGTHHMVDATYDPTAPPASAATVYVDGAYLTSGTMAFGSQILSELVVGSSPSYIYDEAAVYDKALTPTQIAVHAVAGGLAPSLTGGPLSYLEDPSGAGGDHATCFACLIAAEKRGDPVSPEFGSLSETNTDLAIAGRGPGLEFTRTYNSYPGLTIPSGPLGYGWSMGYTDSLTDTTGNPLATGSAPATVRVNDAKASQNLFTLTAGAYTSAAPRVTAKLTRDAVSGKFTLVRRATETDTFSPTGQLLSIADPNRNTTALTYTANLLSTITDPGARTLTLTWDTGTGHLPRVTTVVDSAGRTVNYGYGAAGDLTDITVPAWHGDQARHSQYGYDSNHRLVTMRTARFYATGSLPAPPASCAATSGPLTVTSNLYDGAGRVICQYDPNGNKTAFDYTQLPADEAKAGFVTITDPKGNVEQQHYFNGVMTSDVTGLNGPNPASSFYSYDPTTAGIASTVDPTGALTKVTRDADGNVTQSVDPLGRTTKATFNAFDEPLTRTDAANITTTYTYDNANAGPNLVQTATPHRDNQGVSLGADRVTSYTRDPAHPDDVVSLTDPNSRVWTYTYEALTGYRSTAVSPQVTNSDTGTVTNTTLSCWDDTTGLNTKTITAAGVAAAETCATASPQHATTTSFDFYGHPLSVTDPLGHATAAIYDGDGHQTSSTDADSKTTGTVYDNDGRPTQTNRFDGTNTRTTYFADGTLQTQIDAANAATNYTYDPNGHLTSVTDPNNRTTNYTSDLAGRPMTVADPGGTCAASPSACTSYAYDPAGELTSIGYSSAGTPSVTAITYDPDGRRTAMTTSAGTQHWVWDSLGQLTSTDTPAGGTVGYGWDLKSQLTTIVYPGSKTVTRHYDNAGRFDSVTDWLNNTTGFAYDADTDHTSTTFPAASTNVDTTSFDRAHVQRTTTFKTGAATTAALTYTPDNANQLQSTTQSGLPGDPSTSYGYDQSQKLTAVNGATNTSYGYSTADNLTTLLDGTQQVFDPANQLCYTAPAGTPTGTCTTPPAGAANNTYDTKGERTATTPAYGRPTLYAYDQAGRLNSSWIPQTVGNAGEYSAVAPARILDTRTATRTGTCTEGCTTLAAGQTRTLTVAGVAGIPATGVQAAQLDVTAQGPTGAGTVTVYPADVSQPATSNLNYVNAAAIANSVTVKLSADGKVKLTNNSASASVDLTVDAVGWYATSTGGAGVTFTAVTPARILDTRTATRTGTCTGSGCLTIAANSTLTAKAAGLGGIPAANVSSVIANLTVVGPTAAGSAVVYASNATQPAVTSSTWASGQTVGTQITTKIGADGYIKITNTSTGTIDVAMDVQGWYSTGTPTNGTVLTAVTPTRVLSTVAPTTGTCTPSPCTAWTATAGTKDVKIAGLGGVPASGVNSVAVTITVTNNSATTTENITAWAGGSTTAQPAAVTNLTVAPGQTLSNEAVVPLTPWLVAPAGYININTTTASDVRIDVNGYYNGADTAYNYSYDPDGQRAAKTTAFVPTNYTWDRTTQVPQMIAETTSGNTTNYIYGPDGTPIEQINPNGTVYWYHTDRQNSIRAVTNSTGATIDTNTFDPYGKPAGHTGTTTVPFGYTSAYTDNETGLLYLQHRYYDPTTGQFLTRDPAVAATRGAYRYASSSPLDLWDPSGLSPWDWVKKHKEGIVQGLEVAALVVAVVALPVAGAGLILAAEGEAAFGTLALSTGLGVASNVLSSGASALNCTGNSRSCGWSTSTTAAGWTATGASVFLPGWGAIGGIASACAGLWAGPAGHSGAGIPSPTPQPQQPIPSIDGNGVPSSPNLVRGGH